MSIDEIPQAAFSYMDAYVANAPTEEERIRRLKDSPLQWRPEALIRILHEGAVWGEGADKGAWVDRLLACLPVETPPHWRLWFDAEPWEPEAPSTLRSLSTYNRVTSQASLSTYSRMTVQYLYGANSLERALAGIWLLRKGCDLPSEDGSSDCSLDGDSDKTGTISPGLLEENLKGLLIAGMLERQDYEACNQKSELFLQKLGLTVEWLACLYRQTKHQDLSIVTRWRLFMWIYNWTCFPCRGGIHTESTMSDFVFEWDGWRDQLLAESTCLNTDPVTGEEILFMDNGAGWMTKSFLEQLRTVRDTHPAGTQYPAIFGGGKRIATRGNGLDALTPDLMEIIPIDRSAIGAGAWHPQDGWSPGMVCAMGIGDWIMLQGLQRYVVQYKARGYLNLFEGWLQRVALSESEFLTDGGTTLRMGIHMGTPSDIARTILTLQSDASWLRHLTEEQWLRWFARMDEVLREAAIVDSPQGEGVAPYQDPIQHPLWQWCMSLPPNEQPPIEIVREVICFAVDRDGGGPEYTVLSRFKAGCADLFSLLKRYVDTVVVRSRKDNAGHDENILPSSALVLSRLKAIALSGMPTPSDNGATQGGSVHGDGATAGVSGSNESIGQQGVKRETGIKFPFTIRCLAGILMLSHMNPAERMGVFFLLRRAAPMQPDLILKWQPRYIEAQTLLHEVTCLLESRHHTFDVATQVWTHTPQPYRKEVTPRSILAYRLNLYTLCAVLFGVSVHQKYSGDETWLADSKSISRCIPSLYEGNPAVEGLTIGERLYNCAVSDGMLVIDPELFGTIKRYPSEGMRWPNGQPHDNA